MSLRLLILVVQFNLDWQRCEIVDHSYIFEFFHWLSHTVRNPDVDTLWNAAFAFFVEVIVKRQTQNGCCVVVYTDFLLFAVCLDLIEIKIISITTSFLPCKWLSSFDAVFPFVGQSHNHQEICQQKR